MKHKKTKLSIVLLVLGLTLQAQQSITATGGDATGSGGTAAYSIGQLVYSSHNGSGGTASEGVQQAFEIFTLSTADPTMNLELIAYPNPTTDFLTLKVGNADFSSDLSYQIIDIMGRVIETRDIANTSETIQMGHLPKAMYFLKISNTNNQVKTFKIIKN